MEKDLRKSQTISQSIEVPSTSKITINILPETIVNTSRSSGIHHEVADEHHQSVFLRDRESSCCFPEGTKSYFRIIKVVILGLMWTCCAYVLITNNERENALFKIVIPKHSSKGFVLNEHPKDEKLKVMLKGKLLPPYYSNLTDGHMDVWVQLMVVKEIPASIEAMNKSNVILLQNITEIWKLPLATYEYTEQIPTMHYSKVFHLMPYEEPISSYHLLRIQFNTNIKSNFTVFMKYNIRPNNPDDGVIYAVLILVLLYGMIIFDIIHRTMASIISSTISIATLAIFDQRPSMAELISWIDIETLILLFSMMTIVSILSETGVFDYAAVYAFKKSGGRLWPLINLLCVLTAVCACLLDTVTTALLFTPVTIRLCEVMKINPIQILLYTLVFANIGGAITPIGDPPNVIIASNPDVVKSGITFASFTLHMGIGSCLALIVVYIQIRILYRNMKYYQFDEPPQIQDLKREIAVWERTAASVSSYSKDENLVKERLLKETAELQSRLKDTVNNHDSSCELNVEEMDNLEKEHPIKNKILLVKSAVTLATVIILFFCNSTFSKLGIGWTALLGVILLLVLYDTKDLEGIFARVEWSTLIFFASLFILMEALSRLGLIDWIGEQTAYIITSVGPDSRLATAVVLILWVSSVASAFVDNLPLTTMMIRIATSLSNNESLNLPLPPLIWALSFGSCLGGNGSLFGSSSNIICAGVAEQHGYRFTFIQFTKVGLPVTITSTVVITIYLLICHVVLEWQ